MLHPHVLRNVGSVEASATILGRPAATPMVLAPTCFKWIRLDDEEFPWGIIYSKGFETGIGGPNERIIPISTADLGPGKFSADATGVIVRLTNGEECETHALAQPWTQTGAQKLTTEVVEIAASSVETE